MTPRNAPLGRSEAEDEDAGPALSENGWKRRRRVFATWQQPSHDKGPKDGQAVLSSGQPDANAIVTLSLGSTKRYRNAENGASERGAGMAQSTTSRPGDEETKDMGVGRTTTMWSSPLTTARSLHLADGGQTPCASPGNSPRSGFACPRILRWPGLCRRTRAETEFLRAGMASDLRAAVASEHHRRLLKGKTIGERNTKNHLDGKTRLRPSPGKEPGSAASRNFYLAKAQSVRCALTTISFVLSTSQSSGHSGPIRTCTLYHEPSPRSFFFTFERTGWPNNGTKTVAAAVLDWFKFTVLAVRVRPADAWARNSTTFLETADAAGREFQP